MAFKKFGAPADAHLSFVQPEASGPAIVSADAEARAQALREAALVKATSKGVEVASTSNAKTPKGR